MRSSFKFAAMLAVALFAQQVPSHALTVGFGLPHTNDDPYTENGFNFDFARIVNGNCDVKPCLALNPNETSVLTRVGSDPVFSLNSFWFKLLGKKDVLSVTSYIGNAVDETFAIGAPTYDHNTAYVYSHLFDNVTSIKFTEGGDEKGNVRIDSLNLSNHVSAVPLPAGLPLLATGLIALGLIAQRRRKAF